MTYVVTCVDLRFGSHGNSVIKPVLDSADV